jgi:hypothetical protein
MQVGSNQTIIIKAGTSVVVKGHEGNMLVAETKGRWGLDLERHSAKEVTRARAVVGETVLFDIKINKPNTQPDENGSDEVIEVKMGTSGEVLVPFSANLKIYAGKDIDVRSVKGQVDAYAGLNLNLQEVYRLGNASAGWSMKIDCQTMEGSDVTYNAGRDLHFHVANLTSARLRVKDIGGYWEARIGAGEKSVYLKSGGDVTLVTEQKVEAQPPEYILGKIEKPDAV